MLFFKILIVASVVAVLVLALYCIVKVFEKKQKTETEDEEEPEESEPQSKFDWRNQRFEELEEKRKELESLFKIQHIESNPDIKPLDWAKDCLIDGRPATSLSREDLLKHLKNRNVKGISKMKKDDLLLLALGYTEPVDVLLYRTYKISVYMDDYGQCYDVFFFDENGKLHSECCGTYNTNYEQYVRHMIDSHLNSYRSIYEKYAIYEEV